MQRCHWKLCFTCWRAYKLQSDPTTKHRSRVRHTACLAVYPCGTASRAGERSGSGREAWISWPRPHLEKQASPQGSCSPATPAPHRLVGEEHPSPRRASPHPPHGWGMMETAGCWGEEGSRDVGQLYRNAVLQKPQRPAPFAHTPGDCQEASGGEVNLCKDSKSEPAQQRLPREQCTSAQT